ncbi:MAG: hypothetical protein WCE75_06400, partial [Terracidiphilus sp.]
MDRLKGAWLALVRTCREQPRLAHTAAVLLGAAMLFWPAVYNGYPLLYPDSMSYLGQGPAVARALFLRQFSEYYGVRSFHYSLGILPFHWNRSAWPVAALQCQLVAWVVWLVVRVFAPRRPVVAFLAVLALLSVLTSASWYACFVMPDVLGPLVYLAFFLLVFARSTLSRRERWALGAVACWGITAHATHLLVAAGLLAVLALVA